ncbi:unnamed protein product [Bathycoccus prasinos]
MPPKAPESKAAKLAKAAAGGKAKKKKWSKGKSKEKAQNQVLFEQSTYDKLLAEVPKYKMITVSILCDRLRITCSLARKGIAILVAKGLIKPVVRHSQQDVYTRAIAEAYESHWNERDIVSKKESHEWMWTFTDEENDEIELALRHFRATNLDVMDVTAETFPLSSSFQNKLLAMREEILQGRGFAVQRGLNVARYSNKDICTIFCAIGKIMGIPVSQNKFGHVLGHVYDLGNDPLSPSTRLYTTSAAQPFHTDSADIVGLLCIRNAPVGGDSQWVSSVRCYEEIKRERADLAEVLLQPFFVSRKGEIPPGCGPTYEMAVFHEVEDEKNIIGIYDRSFIDAAQTIEGTPKLTSLQIEALNYLDALCIKRQIEMRLQSGDIQWLHNHTTFHARSAFKNESEFPRHLLRLWLSPENGIKLPDAFKTRFNSTERGSPNRGGIKIKDDVKLVCPLEP